ncbi:single-stranded-DNA-specific exonuclease RecJ [Haloplanus salinarum]|uniref:single-stranded-DNA-specific exonuclease RecJ n=1 Tax=Haloplanus salinarum TaxID=1912324 RepID=UPI00214AC13A|nr:DHH family phosphoesterase [Haloplanus salinarum]
MTGPVPELAERAAACADRLRTADSVLLASHIDADGLTSAAVAATALERAGVPFETVFEKQLDEAAVRRMAATDHDTVLFTDFGSGQLDVIAGFEGRGAFVPVIADHHQPADATTTYHLNPLLVGIDGASELSGAGAAYVLARALEADGVDNRDLAALAVVGAVGDMQGGVDGLTGANGGIVAEGVAAGVLGEGTDLAMYGRQTRPLPKLLQYASDVRIPGITGDEAGAVEFLAGLDADLRGDGEWKRWVDLTDDDRRTVASALLKRAVASGVPADRVDDLIGTTYTLTAESEGTELRDVSEFSTLLNATARYERADVGLAVCLGDRGAALERARTLLRNHRRNLSNGLELVKSEGVTVEGNVQWFDAGGRIRETIVGIVAGMALGADGIRRDLPIVAFASVEPSAEGEGLEERKVSARGSHALVREGLDLSAVMREAARSVGGDGGGHDVAAGATIPADERAAFVEAVDRLVGEQLG